MLFWKIMDHRYQRQKANSISEFDGIGQQEASHGEAYSSALQKGADANVGF
jgi:hypothetical protein